MIYKNVNIPKIFDFNIPVFVENRNFRTNNTKHYFDLSFNEVGDLPKQNGVIVSTDLVHFVDCPVCEQRNNRQLFVKWGFKVVACNTCSHVYVENQILPNNLEDLYTSSQSDKQAKIRKKDDSELSKYWTLLYSKYLQLLQKETSNNLLLDLGAGGGEFLELCKELSDYKLYAMEFSEYSAEHLTEVVGAKKLYRDRISETDFNGVKFDAITMWGVLEHMDKPYIELVKCKEILSKNGRILILVPNFYSRAFDILGATVPTLNPRSHLNYFNKTSMEYLCNKVGLSVVEYYQELPVIDLMYDFIDFNDGFVNEIIENNESYYSVYLLSH